jgi:purine-nucleoside phosphorylase
VPSISPPSSIAARLDDCVFAIRKRISLEPVVGVVLGSGLGAFADTLEELVKIPYRDLPHMPASAVAGHEGNLCFGRVRGVPVVCMQGRVHLYEGHPVEKVVQGVRAMARLGVRTVLLTNAAGGLEPSWAAGDLMSVTDHINLSGVSPLVGPNDDALGPRFPDMSTAYDLELRAALRDVARDAGIPLREGVYACLLGPSYETPAEVRMVRMLGAQAVGMSTAHEVIALRHMGVRVGALSCITNQAAGIAAHPLSHEEVEATARARRPELLALLGGWVERSSQTMTVERSSQTTAVQRVDRGHS